MSTDLDPAAARRIIYRSLMAGGDHSPERSEKATATIEALIANGNAELERLRQQVAAAERTAARWAMLRTHGGAATELRAAMGLPERPARKAADRG